MPTIGDVIHKANYPLNTTPGFGVAGGPLSATASSKVGPLTTPGGTLPFSMSQQSQLAGPLSLPGAASQISSKVLPGAAAAGGGGGAAITAGVASAAAMPMGQLIAASIIAAPVIQAVGSEAMARIESPDGSFQQYQIQGQGGGSGAAKMGHASIVGALNKAAGTRSRM